MMRSTKPFGKITIVVPVHNEELNLVAFHDKVVEVVQGLTSYAWEFVFVDDGSRDSSWSVIEALSRSDASVRGVCLSRNFGKEVALTAGVEAARGSSAVVCIDADLQHPPDLIAEFVKAWENGAEIVIAIRQSCEDYTLVKKLGSRLFYAIMSKMSDVDLSPNTTDFRLLDCRVVEALCQFTERSRIFRGIIDWMGFRKEYIPFTAPARQHGAPAYSYGKLFHLALNSFTSFSLVPLRVTGIIGLAVTVLSALLLVFMVVGEHIWKLGITPSAYFVVLNTLLSGVLLSAIGIISLYIGQIHTEAINRPLYIVRERTDGQRIREQVPPAA